MLSDDLKMGVDSKSVTNDLQVTTDSESVTTSVDISSGEVLSSNHSSAEKASTAPSVNRDDSPIGLKFSPPVQKMLEKLPYDQETASETSMLNDSNVPFRNFAQIMSDALGTDLSRHELPIFDIPPSNREPRKHVKPVNWAELFLQALGLEFSEFGLPIFE